MENHDSCGIGAVVNIDGKKDRRAVSDALTIVKNLSHRAGVDALGTTGDGVGIMTSIPHKLFKTILANALPDEGSYGVAMIFFSKVEWEREQAMKLFEHIAQDNGLKVFFWREVPVDSGALGELAKTTEPSIWEAFLSFQNPTTNKENKESLDNTLEKVLYRTRREVEKAIKSAYIASMSNKTIVHKGMMKVEQLDAYYKDLSNEDFISEAAIVHSRFSTNTTPDWRRAHPYRLLAHNGEINTIRGNADRMKARGNAIEDEGSDSAMLDNTIEYMIGNGIPLPKALMICIPESSYGGTLSEDRADFYHYWSTMMEAWDGPAAILAFDGETFCATLDRNGLRPVRYYRVKKEDGGERLVLSSEVGVLDIPDCDIISKGRLSGGRMLSIDLKERAILFDDEIKSRVTKCEPYGEWLATQLIQLKDLKIPNKKIPLYTQDERDHLYRAFAWNYEDVNDVILNMAKNGTEPLGSMGVDTPLAFMSEAHPPLFSYFKQQFAQVTNPPLDSIREKCTTDTKIFLGSEGDLFFEKPENCHVLEVHNPILTGVDLIKIKALHEKNLSSAVVSINYWKGGKLEDALDDICRAVDDAYNKGDNIIILSDRGVDMSHIPVPALLATSAVEQHLVQNKTRTAVSVVLETAQVRTVHEAAAVIAFGARAVNPYLAHECISELIDQKLLDKDYHTAIEDYNKALLDGVVKVASKMGIATIASYQSAQIFEALGISKAVVDRYFCNTKSRAGGIGLKELEEDVLFHHNKGFDPMGLSVNSHLDSVGVHKARSGEGAEDHLYSPAVITALQKATRTGSPQDWRAYTALVDDEGKPHTIRAMMDFDFDKAKSEGRPIPLEEVESASEIVKSFKTGAMSYGSISLEAHEALAEAMNHLGGKSNSGEGGEIRERLGSPLNSAIKQVASGRFGVTEEYLLSAKEIQIKMAQGAKPGEGGHLPGKKVYPWIAATRLSTPGVSLISPPPHHDIYSIEDLAQLIYDLKNANRRARISVKLVSEAGVGTVASGVAKAGSLVILISGHDGGTGAAPLGSIHGAGLPWELGVAETQRALMENGLRSRVIIEADGKLMSARDVAIACLLGAEEFGFATAPLVTLGCAMMRACQKDTCPFGVATQNKGLRERFQGKAEYVERFMLFIAEDLRAIMAQLGFHTISEMCGKSEYLTRRKKKNFSRADLIDLSDVLLRARNCGGVDECRAHKNNIEYNFSLEKTLDERTLLPWFNNAGESPCEITLSVNGRDRTLGTILGSAIEEKYHSKIDADHFVVRAEGSAGQSLGAFIPKGLLIHLKGDANDYVGKGLSGGTLVIQPPTGTERKSFDNVLIGNVALYGATSGRAFIAGLAGERFAVRNSGALAVVEGVGDHGCEYMTGGTVIILSSTIGKNFAAGMSGGVAYVYDKDHTLYKKLNKTLVDERPVDEKDKDLIKSLILEHEKFTSSALAADIIKDFDSALKDFRKVIARDYERVLKAIEDAKENGASDEDAKDLAFKSITSAA